MRVYAGLEGGGTKTDIWLGAAQGSACARKTAGPSSLSRSSPATVRATLNDALRSGLQECGGQTQHLRGICAGFAGAGRYASSYGELLRELAPQARVRIMSDAELAWLAATDGGDGIVVIAGTGSIVWGSFQGRTRRIGGLGPGRDPGSGDTIGRAAVAAGLISSPEDANYAALVPKLAAEARARGLLTQAGEALAAQVRECAAQLGWSQPVVYYWGGVLENVPAVRESLQSAWGSSLLAVKRRPAEVALNLARQLPD